MTVVMRAKKLIGYIPAHVAYWIGDTILNFDSESEDSESWRTKLVADVYIKSMMLSSMIDDWAELGIWSNAPCIDEEIQK